VPFCSAIFTEDREIVSGSMIDGDIFVVWSVGVVL